MALVIVMIMIGVIGVSVVALIVDTVRYDLSRKTKRETVSYE